MVLTNMAGSLAQIVNLFAERGINIVDIKTLNRSTEVQELEAEIEIQNADHLSDVLASARSLKSVYSIKRF